MNVNRLGFDRSAVMQMRSTSPLSTRGGSRRLVALNTPTPIQVRTDATDTPLEVQLGHHRVRVTEIQERWRIDDEWWRTPICRIYHRVVLNDGRILTVYRDLESGGWFIQR